MSTTNWLEKAQELAEEPTRNWKPQKDGEAIAGRVVSIDVEAGKNHDGVFVELRDEVGQITGLWLTTVLRQQFERLHVEPGDVVGIKYHGRRQSQAGREYKAFSVAIIERKPDDDIPL